MERVGQVADWWDEQKRESEKALNQFVEEHPDWFGILVAGSVQTAMDLGAGFVDVLRLGEGAAEGGWGYAEDALRLLVISGPAGKALRVGRIRLAKFMADPNPAAGACTWVAASKALRQTGTRHFATVDDLLRANGISTLASKFNKSIHIRDIVPILQKLGAKVRFLTKPKSMNDVANAVKNNPNGVVLFAVEWWSPTKQKVIGHALYAFRDALGRFRISDRTGRIVSSLKELESSFKGIGTAKPYTDMAFVADSTLVQGIEGLLPASVLALEIRTLMLVNQETADEEMQKIKTNSASPDTSWRAYDRYGASPLE